MHEASTNPTTHHALSAASTVDPSRLSTDHAVGVNLGTTNTAMTPASDGESYARGTLADHEEQEDDEGADESKNSKHSLAYSEDAEPDTVAKAEPPQAVASSGGGVSSDGAGGDRLAPEERVTVERGSAQSIAEQLDYEASNGTFSESEFRAKAQRKNREAFNLPFSSRA